MPDDPPSIQGASAGRRAVFPLWLKIAAAAFLAVFVPVYWIYYGPMNFLWFSNIGLIGTIIALCLENRLLAGMMLLNVLIPDGVGWNGDFLLGLIADWHPIHATNYMFDPAIPLFIRGLSLYHVITPWLLVWMVHRLGYDRRALAAQVALGWSVLLFAYFFTDPAININAVFSPTPRPQTFMPAWMWLVVVMLYCAVVFYLPVHILMRRLGYAKPVVVHS